jgi:hypothetical protein
LHEIQNDLALQKAPKPRYWYSLVQRSDVLHCTDFDQD